MDACAAALDQLETGMRGTLLRPGSDDYERERRVWNGMIDLRPAAIARCASTEDVCLAVRTATAAEIPVAVRGGGHGVAGFATIDDGLVIDLEPINRVDVDVDRRRVRVGGGAKLGDLDAATQQHALVVPSGVVSATGVAGLTLSGGLGWARRAFGMTCDNLVGATLVTGAGDVVDVTPETEPELLWGLRGGGGNFGIVTEFEFTAHPLGPDVAFLFTFYPIDDTRAVIAAHERIVEASDDRISTIVVFGHVPPTDDFPAEIHEVDFVGVLGMYAGAADAGEQALRPLRELGTPLVDLSTRMPYVEAQTIYDADYPEGHRYYWKSTNLAAIDDGVADVLVEYTKRAPSLESTVDVWLGGGAIGRVADDATAFAGRANRYVVNLEANWEHAADDDANIAWARETLAALEPFAAGGSYLNFPGFVEEGADLVRASHGGNYARLQALKRRMDPQNVFRRNANIVPG